MILGYILLFILTYIVDFGVAIKLVMDFYSEIYDEGYKINNEIQGKIMKKYKVKTNILDFIPGLNVVKLYFCLRKSLNKVRKDPAFINNLEPLSDIDKMVIGDGENLSFVGRFNRSATIIGLASDVKIRYDDVDLGTYTDEDLKINDGFLSDDVLSKMSSMDKVRKNNEGKEAEQSFYNLSGEYTMSDVFRIDENAIFIKTPDNANVAIVNATKEEINEFLKKSLVVKPNLNTKYHIISIKPFDKNKVRRALVEMEYFNNPIDTVIDMDTLSGEEKGKERKRTL